VVLYTLVVGTNGLILSLLVTLFIADRRIRFACLLQRLVNVVGVLDENFYPAYYEDDDYGIRIHLSGLHALQFNNTSKFTGRTHASLRSVT
jgi:hypothetical protein